MLHHFLPRRPKGSQLCCIISCLSLWSHKPQGWRPPGGSTKRAFWVSSAHYGGVRAGSGRKREFETDPLPNAPRKKIRRSGEPLTPTICYKIYNILQYSTLFYNILQYSSIFFNILQYSTRFYRLSAVICGCLCLSAVCARPICCGCVGFVYIWELLTRRICDLTGP